MKISAALVKELRTKSGAGIMDAKKALIENNGDLEAAIDWLRAKGMSKAAKKSTRETAEGLVCVAVDNGLGSIVEVNSETDFVARNEKFCTFVKELGKSALSEENLDSLLELKQGEIAYKDRVTEQIATLGENISVRRMNRISGNNVASYVHNAVDTNLGKIGVLVALSGDDNGIGKQIAMHVAAANPIALSEVEVSPERIERERTVLLQKAHDTGKPEQIIAKIVDGGIRKFLAEETLLNQKFVIDPNLTVAAAAKAENVKITGYIRYQVGESLG